MAHQDTRKRLIESTKRLLMDGTQVETLTARQISTEAGTNLAMINYCFKSKDELLKIAVDEIVAEEFNQYTRVNSDVKTAKEQLRELLLHVCNAMIKFSSLTRLSIPYLMLTEEITLPFDILPFIRKHYKTRKSETECKVIAFQMVYTMQLIFYRADDFYKYCGIDIQNTESLQDFLDSQLDFFLGDD